MGKQLTALSHGVSAIPRGGMGTDGATTSLLRIWPRLPSWGA